MTRERWTFYLPHAIQDYLFQPRYTRLRGDSGTFQSDAESGLNSSNFNLATNIEGSDSRSGLNEAGKREVRRLMSIRGINFDEARRVVMEQKFQREGIGMDGVPKDPKFVSFS